MQLTLYLLETNSDQSTTNTQPAIT